MSMNFIDKFMLDEDLSTYELESSDFNEISLGIILGNINKIGKISINFVKHLRSNADLDPICKAVFIKRILNDIGQDIKQVPDNNKPAQSILIQEFIEVTEILKEIILYTKLLNQELKIKYSELFSNIMKKFIVNDKIIFIATSSYSLKDDFELESSLFYLDYRELDELSLSQMLNEPFELITLFTKCCKIVHDNKLQFGDLLSIITFNRFLEFINLCLQKNITLNYHQILSILIKYRRNFTVKQELRFRETYYKMLKHQKVLKNSNFEKEFSCDVYPDEPPYVLNKLRRSNYQKSSHRNSLRSQQFNQRMSNNLYEAQREYAYQNQNSEYDEIISEIELIIINIIDSNIQEIDREFVSELLSQFIIISPDLVTNSILNILNNPTFSQPPHYPNWSLIKVIFENIPDYPEVYFHQLAFNILNKYPNYV